MCFRCSWHLGRCHGGNQLQSVAMALAPNSRASGLDWPIRLRLKGLQGEHAQFNGDYVQESRPLARVASWRLEHGSCMMYLEQGTLQGLQGTSFIRFVRTVSEALVLVFQLVCFCIMPVPLDRKPLRLDVEQRISGRSHLATRYGQVGELGS